MRKELKTQPSRMLSIPSSSRRALPAIETLVRSRNAIALSRNSQKINRPRIGIRRKPVLVLRKPEHPLYLLARTKRLGTIYSQALDSFALGLACEGCERLLNAWPGTGSNLKAAQMMELAEHDVCLGERPNSI